MIKVLIVIDMQNDFVTGALGSYEAQIAATNIYKLIMENNWDVIMSTKDTHFDGSGVVDLYENTLEGQMLPIKHCIENTNGWNFVPELNHILRGMEKLPNNPVIWPTVKKYTFGSTTLPLRLEMAIEKRARQLELKDKEFDITVVGVCTDICVVSNALNLRMQFPDTHIYVKADCCAGTTFENHKAALKVMQSCQIETI